VVEKAEEATAAMTAEQTGVATMVEAWVAVREEGGLVGVD
jgi:hypothetical protein